MTDRTEQGTQEKKPYKKPQLKQVSLRPEEAVLGSCKSAGTSGPGSGNCAVPGCSSLGCLALKNGTFLSAASEFSPVMSEPTGGDCSSGGCSSCGLAALHPRVGLSSED